MRHAIGYAQQHLGTGLVIAEIGVLAGEHALQMYMDLRPKKFYLIDPFLEYVDSNKTTTTQRMMDDNLARVCRMIISINENNEHPPFELLRTTSIEASKKFKEPIFDLVYIDALHDRPDVDYDITHWYPLVKEGGILAGHDYCYEPVRNAVHSYLGNYTNIIFSNSAEDWVMHKKKP